MKCAFKNCKKKLGHISFECKCGKTFCSKHRISHNCDYDYQKQNKEKLIKENPLIECKKIDKI